MTSLGTHWWIVKPCGTEAAYRRHYRHGTKPCERCRAAHKLASWEREARRNARLRERYAEARAAGATRDEAGRFSKLREATGE